MSPLRHFLDPAQLLIVGAGPVGLAAAHGAYLRGCRSIAVIDQTRGFGHAGEQIDLQPNGVRALKYVAPAVARKLIDGRRSGSDMPIQMYDVDGKLVNESIRSLPGMEPTVALHWSELQRHLLEELPKDIQVITNSQLIALEYEAGDSEILRAEVLQNRRRKNAFVNWGGDPAAAACLSRDTGAAAEDNCEEGEPIFRSFRAALVIGADGINSRCREIVYRNIGGSEWVPLAHAQYSGFVYFKGRGTVSDEDESAFAEAENTFLANSMGSPAKRSRWVSIGCRKGDAEKVGAPVTMLAHMKGMREVLGWDWMFLLSAAVDEDLARRDSRAGGHSALYAHMLRILKDAGFPQSLMSIGRVLWKEPEENESGDVVSRPLFVVPVDEPAPFERPLTAGKLPSVPDGFYRPFGHGRIFLVGDSLHGMPPFTAQGASMGFEDVVELVDLMAKSQSWENDRGNSSSMPPSCGATLEEVLALYRNSRLHRLSVVQRNTLNQDPLFEVDSRLRFRKFVLDFKPVADGYANNAAL